MKTIKIGTKVVYRPAWGSEPPTTAIIRKIEKCAHKGEKYGKQVNQISWSSKDYGVYDFDNGHWCYGYQIDEIVNTRHKVKLLHQTQRESLENGWDLISLTIYLSDEELDSLFGYMDEVDDDGTLALYKFTHSKECSKHHRYLIWHTFEEGEIKIMVMD